MQLKQKFGWICGKENAGNHFAEMKMSDKLKTVLVGNKCATYKRWYYSFFSGIWMWRKSRVQTVPLSLIFLRERERWRLRGKGHLNKNTQTIFIYFVMFIG